MRRIRATGHWAYRMTCRECATVFGTNTGKSQFCCGDCRNAYDYRRRERGAILYDFLMEMRYRRIGAKGLWSIMCRLAEEWKDQDKFKHDGFQSWKDPREFIERRPYLTGKRGRI